ncbi:hypothetical protein WJX73_001062 [Symbiochloris irregularis]|uniref:Uncharacterized protein n=1 Tax=Symbiochloris irregularis TaxID=706552 RepID=A0AAW1NZC7_9CHLO
MPLNLARPPHSCRLASNRQPAIIAASFTYFRGTAVRSASHVHNLARSARCHLLKRTAAAADDAIPQVSSETGGSGDGGDQDDNRDGPGDWDEDRNGRWNRSAATILAAVICSFVLIILRAFSKKKRTQQAKRTGLQDPEAESVLGAAQGDGPARLREDISALKRLQREAFEQLVIVNARLDQLQDNLDDKAAERAKRLVVDLGYPLTPPGLARTPLALTGVLDTSAVATFSQVDDDNVSSGADAQAHGNPCMRAVAQGRAGNAMFQIHGHAAPSLAAGAASISIDKVLYALKGATWRVLAFPFGGRGSDATSNLNPQAGVGLSALSAASSGVQHDCQGSGAAFTRSFGASSLTGGFFSHDGVSSGLLQATTTAGGLSLSLTAAQHGPPFRLPFLGQASSATPMAHSEIGSTQDLEASSVSSTAFETRRQAVTLAGSCTIAEELRGCAWIAQHDLSDAEREWGISLCSSPDTDGNSWSVSMGRLQHAATASGTAALAAEALCQIPVSDGLMLSLKNKLHSATGFDVLNSKLRTYYSALSAERL